MGAYLSQPNISKISGQGGSGKLSYGYSAMHGWGVSMEDSHNCIPELDRETAIFSVYDGHGGEEVALYCSKYLPDIIKDQEAYKDGKMQKALEDAFLSIDEKLTLESVIKELSQMTGRPINDHEDKNKVADEDDVDNEEVVLRHQEATISLANPGESHLLLNEAAEKGGVYIRWRVSLICALPGKQQVGCRGETEPAEEYTARAMSGSKSDMNCE